MGEVVEVEEVWGTNKEGRGETSLIIDKRLSPWSFFVGGAPLNFVSPCPNSEHRAANNKHR